MRFDYAIMNPPYDRNLHLKFLEKVIKVAGKTVNISPVRWLQDPLAKYKKNSDYNKFENSISKYIERLDLYSSLDAQRLFDIELPMDLGIYTIGIGGFDYKAFSSNFLIDRYYAKNQFAPIEENKYDGWRVKMPKIVTGGCGHDVQTERSLGPLLIFYNGQKENKPWYEWYQRNQNTKTTKEIPLSIKFNTEQEAINFVNSFKTIIARYFCKVIFTNASIRTEQYLWMGDYTKPWTNARFCEYFGITGFVSDTEAEPGSEWETILETMKKYA